jgi:hypothetical protein
MANALSVAGGRTTLQILFIVFGLTLGACGQRTANLSAAPGLQYVLLYDKSGRTLWPGGIEDQANAASQFLKDIVRPGTDVGTLVNFDEDFSIAVENSTQPDDISAKLARQGSHGTRFWEAVVWAEEWLAKQEPSDRKKVIFVFSDGDDDASQTPWEDVYANLHKLHIPVFIIAPFVVEHKRPGTRITQMVSATAGAAYFVGKGSLDFARLKHDLDR